MYKIIKGEVRKERLEKGGGKGKSYLLFFFFFFFQYLGKIFAESLTPRHQ